MMGKASRFSSMRTDVASVCNEYGHRRRLYQAQPIIVEELNEKNPHSESFHQQAKINHKNKLAESPIAPAKRIGDTRDQSLSGVQ